MGDMGEVFRDMRKATKQRKERNLSKNMGFLNSKRIDYEVFNQGYHVRVFSPFGKYELKVEFYPSTNKWVFRGKTYHGTAKHLYNWFRKRVGLEQET